MDYLGVKTKLNSWIFNTLFKYIDKDVGNLSFFDACAGTGSVSMAAARYGFYIISNDVMQYSGCVLKGKFLMSIDLIENAVKHIISVNSIRPTKGFFYKEYSIMGNRLYFTKENAGKIDAARDYIENIQDDILKNYLLYCLLEAVSRISNTAGTYGAFLKKIKKRALLPLTLHPENYFTAPVKIYTEDIIDLLNKEFFSIREDILYIDPPYNERQYGANYHIYETLVRYDSPEVSGVTGLRNWMAESKSLFCGKTTALPFFIKILEATEAKIVLLSYSSDGVMKPDEILLAASIVGFECSLHTKPYRKYKADNKRFYNEDILFEYLFVFARS